MLRKLLIALMVMGALSVCSQANEKRQGNCVTAAGTQSLACTVTVYQTGTTILATIYADNFNTPKANPFTADANTGAWFFYASNGRLDIRFSGGNPSITPAYTLSDLIFQDLLSLTTNSPLLPSLGSESANIAQSGFIQMAPGDCLSWRNNANTGDNCLTENSVDQLVYQGNPIPSTSGTLAVGNCVQAGPNNTLTTIVGACSPPISGFVTITATPAPGQLSGFSGATSITNVDLTGAVTTSGGFATSLGATIPGNSTFSGNINLKNVNKVLHVNSTGGYGTIALALSACPAAPNGCRIVVDDGTTLTNVPSFSLGITPCQNFMAQVLELGVNTSISMNGPITLNCGGYIYGNNRDGNNIVTSGSFPVSNSMIIMGDTTADAPPYHSIDARIEGVELNCNLVAGCTGISAQGLNENSTIGRLAISNYLGNCINIDGTNAPATSNYVVFDIDCANGGTTNDSIVLKNTGTDLIQRITLVANATLQTSGAGIHVTGVASGNFNGHTINTVHCEKHNDCVLIDGNQGAAITYVDAENGSVNGLRIASTANGAVTANYIRSNANSSSPSIINQVTGTTITSSQVAGGIVPLYNWSIGQSEWWIDNVGAHGPKCPLLGY